TRIVGSDSVGGATFDTGDGDSGACHDRATRVHYGAGYAAVNRLRLCVGTEADEQQSEGECRPRHFAPVHKRCLLLESSTYPSPGQGWFADVRRYCGWVPTS